VVTQIALSFGLVTCAALGARSLSKLYHADVGVDGARLLGGRVALFPEAFPEEAQRLAFFERTEERLRALPGVAAATVTSSLPGTFVGGTRIEVEGAPAAGADAAGDRRGRLASVVRGTPSLFDALGVALVSGRPFRSSDAADSEKVAIVNRRFAEAYFEGVEPIGRRFRQVDEAGGGPWLSVVGVAPDLQHDDIDDTLRPTYYLPLAQSVPQFAFVAVRSVGAEAAPLAPSLLKAVHEIAPDQPVYYLRTVDDWIAIVRASNRFLAGLFGSFAFAGLVLAAVGVYGVAAYAVTQRTGEIGVRRALGARDSSVVRLVAGRSAQDLAWGLTVGLGLAIALGRQVGSFFYEAQALDPVVLLSVPLVLVGAVGLATWMPARRALRIEPAVALRGE
jgi:predicted permease